MNRQKADTNGHPARQPLPGWRLIGAIGLLAAGPAVAATPGTPVQSLEAIGQAARTFVEASLTDTIETHIRVNPLDPRLRLSACTLPLSAFLPTGRKLLGHTAIGVRCDDASPWKLYVPVTIDRFAMVWRTARPLPARHLITDTDLTAQRANLGELQRGYFTDKAHVLGQQLKRNTPVGKILGAIDIAPPRAVKRGDQVTILTRQGSLEVRMTGKALTDGATGDRIKVKSHGNSKVIQAIVAGKGLVEVTL
ncbi:MAG: flagellar basal body P-ring formation chaperone FlgA [Gammaproteobacteria bacterium]|nr:flagellar basal body P-ring formation chaperone FlgA [Gammaproteobacteria bacterium]